MSTTPVQARGMLSLASTTLANGHEVIASGGHDKLLRLWGATAPERQGQVNRALQLLDEQQAPGSVFSLAWMPQSGSSSSPLLLSGGGTEREARLWRLRSVQAAQIAATDAITQTSAEVVAVLPGHTGWVRSVACSPGMAPLAFSVGCCFVKCWQLTSSKQRFTAGCIDTGVRSTSNSKPDKVEDQGDSSIRVKHIGDVSAHGDILCIAVCAVNECIDDSAVVRPAPYARLFAGVIDGRIAVWEISAAQSRRAKVSATSLPSADEGAAPMLEIRATGSHSAHAGRITALQCLRITAATAAGAASAACSQHHSCSKEQGRTRGGSSRSSNSGIASTVEGGGKLTRAATEDVLVSVGHDGFIRCWAVDTTVSTVSASTPLRLLAEAMLTAKISERALCLAVSPQRPLPQQSGTLDDSNIADANNDTSGSSNRTSRTSTSSSASSSGTSTTTGSQVSDSGDGNHHSSCNDNGLHASFCDARALVGMSNGDIVIVDICTHALTAALQTADAAAAATALVSDAHGGLKVLTRRRRHEAAVTAVVFGGGGSLGVSGATDGTLECWSLPT